VTPEAAREQYPAAWVSVAQGPLAGYAADEDYLAPEPDGDPEPGDGDPDGHYERARDDRAMGVG
jgi:hypothetical protein